MDALTGINSMVASLRAFGASRFEYGSNSVSSGAARCRYPSWRPAPDAAQRSGDHSDYRIDENPDFPAFVQPVYGEPSLAGGTLYLKDIAVESMKRTIRGRYPVPSARLRSSCGEP